MMTARTIAVVLATILLLGVAGPALAQNQPSLGQVEVTGTVVTLRPGDQSFVLREDRRQDRFWVVEVQPRTRFDFRGRTAAGDDDNAAPGFGGPGNGMPGPGWNQPGDFRLLRVGQIVQVDGRLLAEGRIVAREVTILSFGQNVPPRNAPPLVIITPPRRPPFARPPVRFTPYPPQIFYPLNGSEINTSEFTVVGRTVPGALVRIDVSTSWFLFTFPSGTAETWTDDGGMFTATVRPSTRLFGAAYRITVRATAYGVVLPPTSVTVYQR